MGLTVNYDWKVKADLSAARRMITKFQETVPLILDGVKIADILARELMTKS